MAKKKKGLRVPEMIRQAERAGMCQSELGRLRRISPASAMFHHRAPYWAYQYAAHVAKRRVPELEPVILRSMNWSFWYAKDVIQGAWPEAEPVLAGEDYWIKRYHNEILEGD